LNASIFIIAKSVALFLIAGLLEIGGGYLVWLWLRHSESVWFGVFGGIILFLYGVVPTLQPAPFGRVYAAYGGVFIFLALLWGGMIDHRPPDRFDILGAGVCLIGVGIIMYWPRS